MGEKTLKASKPFLSLIFLRLVENLSGGGVPLTKSLSIKNNMWQMLIKLNLAHNTNLRY